MGVLKNILQGSASAWALSTFVKKSGDTMTGNLVMNSAIYPSSNTESLSANKTLVSTSSQYQFLDPNGANRDVTLPTAATNMLFIISNTSTGIYSLTVKNSGGTAQGNPIAAGVISGFYYNGTSWILC
jgi:hypothetical protein